MDARLIVRHGDPPAALRSFFEAALGAVFPYLSRRCAGNSSVAEDLTQETFFVAVRSLRSGSVDQITVGWLLSVAQSRLIDHYRGQARLSRHLHVIASDDQVARVEEGVVADDAVADLLANLPAAQRLDVVLHHLDGVPVREIGLQTGRTVRAVESSLARARRTLRDLIDEETR